MNENEGLLRTRQAAERLALSPETVRRFAQAGKIRALRLPSGQYRFRPADLIEYADQRKRS